MEEGEEFVRMEVKWSSATVLPVAAGLQVVPWADDVSGNRSKQYNPHVNIHTKNLNEPSEKLKQQNFVRFRSTSPNAGSN